MDPISIGLGALGFFKKTWKVWAILAAVIALGLAANYAKKTYWDAPRIAAAKAQEDLRVMTKNRDDFRASLETANKQVDALGALNAQNQRIYAASLAQVQASLNIANTERAAAQARANRYAQIRENIANAPAADDGPVPDVLLDTLGQLRNAGRTPGP